MFESIYYPQYPLSVLYSVYYRTNVASVPSGVPAYVLLGRVGTSPTHEPHSKASEKEKDVRAQSKSMSAGVL